jgi:KaiC/GvpD/RAD55 family RecA-like ATPase
MSRLPTYVSGFDEALGGGIPEGHIVLISGGPGTMKTSLAYSIMHNNAVRNGHLGLYISLEQSRESLLAHVRGLGMERGEDGDGVSILDLATLRKRMDSGEQVWQDFFKMYTQSIKRSFDYDILALDSLDALEILAEFQNTRMEVFELFKWLRSLRATCFLITEMPRTLMPYAGVEHDFFEAFSKHKEDALADGIIHLKMEKRGDFEVQRMIRCVKLRSARHNTSYQIFLHDDDGFRAVRALSL